MTYLSPLKITSLLIGWKSCDFISQFFGFFLNLKFSSILTVYLISLTRAYHILRLIPDARQHSSIVSSSAVRFAVISSKQSTFFRLSTSFRCGSCARQTVLPSLARDTIMSRSNSANARNIVALASLEGCCQIYPCSVCLSECRALTVRR